MSPAKNSPGGIRGTGEVRQDDVLNVPEGAVEVNTAAWYDALVTDVKTLEFTGVVATKHAIGRRVLEDFEKFGNPEYGARKVERLARDVGIQRRELYRCVQFAEKYPSIESVPPGHISWRDVRDNLLPAPREERDVTPPVAGRHDRKLEVDRVRLIRVLVQVAAMKLRGELASTKRQIGLERSEVTKLKKKHLAERRAWERRREQQRQEIAQAYRDLWKAQREESAPADPFHGPEFSSIDAAMSWYERHVAPSIRERMRSIYPAFISELLKQVKDERLRIERESAVGARGAS